VVAPSICYPRPVLGCAGLVQEQAMGAVKEPRAAEEFGTVIPEGGDPRA
jgi:hypothetical protein